MKFVKFTTSWLLLLTLAGCVSSGVVHNAGPISARKPFDLDVILVNTSSSLGDLEAEKQMLNDNITSGLRETGLFTKVGGNKADLGVGSGITINADITEIRKVSKSKRLWEGAVAGRARIRVHVTVCDFNSGAQIETFETEGESSGGSALAGTTDEAIARAAGEVVVEILKINEQTAK